jgi:hypothetical protein
MMLDVALQSQALVVSGGLPSASWQVAWLGTANFTPADLASYLLKQVGCVSGRNRKIRTAKAVKHREIYANHFTVSIKEWST